MPPAPATDWPEYDQLVAYDVLLSQALQASNDDVVRRLGRNDTPEALAILTPLRDALRDVAAKQRALVMCEKNPVKDPGAMFTALGISVSDMGRPDGDSLRAYVESRVMDGTITAAEKQRLFRIIGVRSRVMNPASKGAFQIAAATAGALTCFGIDTPGDGKVHQGAPDRSMEPQLLAKKYAADHHISFYSYRVDRIGNTNGDFAPILVLADGSTVIVGTTSDIPPGGTYQIGKSHAVMVKLDPHGRLAWQRNFDRKGFLDYEGGGAAAGKDGSLFAFVLSYVHPARMAQSRFVKVTARGKPVWDLQLPGTRRNTPFPSKTVRLADDGSIELTGHVYLDDGMHSWTGMISAAGKLVANTNGAPVPGYGGAGYGGTTYGGGGH